MRSFYVRWSFLLVVWIAGGWLVRAAEPAPAFLWELSSTNGSGQGFNTAVVVDGEDHTYAAGAFSGVFDFGGVTLTNSNAAPTTEYFVGRWDAEGHAEWVRPIRGTNLWGSCALGAAERSGVWVLGPFQGPADFGETNLVTAEGAHAYFLARYEATGALKWVRVIASGGIRPGYGVLAMNRPVVVLAVAGDNDLRIAGEFDGTMALGEETLTGDSGDIFLARCDAWGEPVWSRVIGGNGGVGGVLLGVHRDGHTMACASFDDGVNLGTTNLVGKGQMVARFDDQGDLVWVRRLAATAMATDAGGATYITAGYATLDSFDDMVLTDPPHYSTGTYLAKLGPGGETVWVRTIAGSAGSNEALSLACNAVGDVHWISRFAGGAEIFGASAFYSQTMSRLLARYTSEGVLLWCRADPWPLWGYGSHLALRSAGDAMLGDSARFLARLAASDAVSPVTIRRQPVPMQIIPEGEEAVLDVEADGAEPKTYRWLKVDTEIPGGTNRLLRLAWEPFIPTNFYRVVVSNQYGAVTSAIASLFVAGRSDLPEFLWAKQGGGYGGRDDKEGGRAVCVDSVGDIYFAADYALWARFDGEALAARGAANFALIKYTSDGRLLWLREGPGHGSDYAQGVAADDRGHVYLTGGWDHPEGEFFGATNPVYTSRFLAKYDTSGGLIWARPTGGTAVVAGQGGAVFVLGDQWGDTSLGHTNLAESGGFAAKYDGAGECEWLQFLPQSVWGAGRPTVDNAGGFVAAGYFATNTVIDGVTLTNTGPGQGTFIVRFDAFGRLDWVRQGSWSGQYPRIYLASDAERAVYGATGFRGTFELGATRLVSSNEVNSVVFRLGPSGQPDWVVPLQAEVGFVQGTGIAVDPVGTVYVVGEFNRSLAIGDRVLNSIGESDAFIARLDRSGSCLGIRQVGGQTRIVPWAVAVDARGHALVAGAIGTVTEAPGLMTAIGPSVVVGRGFTDAFVAKLDTPLPVLEVAQSVQGLVLSWLVRGSELDLESADALSGGLWVHCSELVTEVGNRREVKVTAIGQPKFFRLHAVTGAGRRVAGLPTSKVAR